MKGSYFTLLILIPLVTCGRLSRLSVKLLGDKYQLRHPKGRTRKTDWMTMSEWPNIYQTMPLRPSPSSIIPLDIQENPNKALDPPEISLEDEYALISQLGEDYDSQYMSIRRPLEMTLRPNGRLHYQFKGERGPTREDLPLEIQALSDREIKLQPDGPSLRVKFNKRIKRKIQKFLWAYSFCPVRYKWKQLSNRFWPPYIKSGSCDNTKSCSIPAGMTCQPSQMRDIKILRYYCPIVGSQRSCQWIKFDYPILDKCKCACEEKPVTSVYTFS